MELSLACLGSILAILKSFKLCAELAIFLGGSICYYLSLSCLTRHLHDGTLKMLLVMGLVWILKVIAFVAVNFPEP